MGVQWKYLWPGAGAGRRTVAPARAGGRLPVSPPSTPWGSGSAAEGASLRQVVVEHSDGGAG